jgi:hypothetical protein
MLMVPELFTDLAGIAIGIGLLVWQYRVYPREGMVPLPQRAPAET